MHLLDRVIIGEIFLPRISSPSSVHTCVAYEMVGVKVIAGRSMLTWIGVIGLLVRFMIGCCAAPP